MIDRSHPLHNAAITDRVLVLPGGRGSCTGSQVILELLLAERAPAAIVLRDPDDIIALGSIVGDELFGRSFPVVSVGSDGFAALLDADGQHAHVDDGAVVVETADAPPPGRRRRRRRAPALSVADQRVLDGDRGEAERLALRIVTRVAAVQGARELVDVSQVHIDGCIYIGGGGLRFAERLVEAGGRVRVPTTLNAISVDYRRWRELGVPQATGERGGARRRVPGARRDAVVHVRAVPARERAGGGRARRLGRVERGGLRQLGAGRAPKYADFLDACVALTGRAPAAGAHLDDGRRATLELRIPPLPPAAARDDSVFPTLGYACGLHAEGRVAVLSGLEDAAPTADELKAFSAAFGTTAAAPLFHIAGVTPEAPTVAAAVGLGANNADEVEAREVTADDLRAAWAALDSGDDEAVQLIALGNPHLSLSEWEQLATLCAAERAAGRRVHDGVRVVITSGREVMESARAAGTRRRPRRLVRRC